MIQEQKDIPVLLGLWSSIGNKKHILDGACREVQRLWVNFEVSSYIESAPLWGVALNTFLNAVCYIETSVFPVELLHQLQVIEKAFGRTRDIKWEDRTLDIDILYYWNEIFSTRELVIPHPEIANRDFVTWPILELFPEFKFKRPYFSTLKLSNMK